MVDVNELEPAGRLHLLRAALKEVEDFCASASCDEAEVIRRVFHLTWAYLTGADLTGADLTGADLTGTNLDG